MNFDVCVFITSYFPPSRMAGARRPFLIALRLVEIGVPVLIRNKYGWTLCKNADELVDFCRKSTDTGRFVTPGLLGLILRHSKNLLVLPEALLGLLRGINAVRSLPHSYLSSARHILILSTTPPITTGFAGCVLKCWFTVKGQTSKLWFDYRDEWATNPIILRPKVSQKLAIRLEKIIVRASELLTLVAESQERRMLYTQIRPTKLIYNGYNQIELSYLVSAFGQEESNALLVGLLPNTYVVYPGSFPRNIYDYREFQLLHKRLIAQNITLVIAGGEADPSEGFFNISKLPGVLVIPRMKYGQLIPLLKNSLGGVLFTLKADFGGYLTTKVFDYTALGLPIIFSDKMNNDELRNFLTKIGHPVFSLENLPDLKSSKKNDSLNINLYKNQFDSALDVLTRTV